MQTDVRAENTDVREVGFHLPLFMSFECLRIYIFGVIEYTLGSDKVVARLKYIMSVSDFIALKFFLLMIF
jgi:hypothetical protein